MSSDVKIPGWAEKAAQDFHDKWETGMSGAAFRDLVRALLAAEQKGRKAGLEEAANKAKYWLEDWGQDLQATFEEYCTAQRTGTMNGRRIRPEQARFYAGQFKERADAVYDCGEKVAAAIRSLGEKP